MDDAGKSSLAKNPSATAALAERLGLSRWAVSRALNGRPGVSAETVARVRAEAARGGYAPSELARGLRAGGTALAGICLPDPETFYLSGRLGLLAGRLGTAGCGPVFQIADGTEESEARAMGFFAGIGCRAVGVIAARLGAGHPAVSGLLARGVRVVHIDPVGERLGVPGVTTDRALAMRRIVQHLHKTGHRAACLAGIDAEDAYGRQRLRGLKAGAAACGWKRAPAPLPEVAAPDEFAEGAQLADHYLTGKYPRAVIARNDRVAFGFARRMRAHGRKMPGDYVVAGYDATPLAGLFEPPIATVDPGHEQLVEVAVGLLSAKITPSGIVKIAPRLVVNSEES